MVSQTSDCPARGSHAPTPTGPEGFLGREERIRGQLAEGPPERGAPFRPGHRCPARMRSLALQVQQFWQRLRSHAAPVYGRLLAAGLQGLGRCPDALKGELSKLWSSHSKADVLHSTKTKITFV